jgi:putative RecB family exonuclease
MIGLANQDRAKGKPDGIAGRDYISWSQLSTFRQCPLKYRFRYLDKLEPEFVASSLLVGSSIHSAIEFHHRKQLESDEPATLYEMLEAFWGEWKDRVEESPEVRFGKNEDAASVGQLAERMLAAFLASELSQSPGRMIGIEESFRETVIPGRPELLGIIDLVFESDDCLVIRDYKTSRSKWNQGNAESSAPQLLMYAELVKDLLPGRKLRLEFAVLTKTKSPSLELFVVTPDGRRLERTKQVASRTLDAIDTGVFYPNASAMNCGGCPYRSACRAWRG